MNRRRFLWEGITGGALVLGAGGVLFVRRSQARAEMTSRMLDDALPPLTSNALQELNTLPVRGREEIRRYFHGKCLNVQGFVTNICSNHFAERLGRCQTADERENCFLYAFCSRVASEAEILNQVETVTADIGSKLDAAWSTYCASISGRWSARIQEYGSRLSSDELSDRLGTLIRAELDAAARGAVRGNLRPSIGQTIGRIGESAVRLLPLATVRVGAGVAPRRAGAAVTFNPFVIPVFFIEAARHVWDYIMGRLDDRRADYQPAISGSLARLGNRVGAEFEREVRLRLTDLHSWQERSVRDTATRLAEERVNLF